MTVGTIETSEPIIKQEQTSDYDGKSDFQGKSYTVGNIWKPVT